MKQLIAFFLMTTLFASCGGHTIPGDIIPSEQMGTIMWQLMQSDEYVNTLIAKDSSKKSSTERMKIYQQVFDLNKTSADQFKKSYQFYMEHPDIGKLIFDSITVRAGRERIEIMSTRTDTLLLKGDSIRRARAADSLAHARPDSLHLRPAGKSLIRPDTGKIRPIILPKRRVKKPRLLTHQ